MNPYDRTEKIDNYLENNMSNEEQKEFERLLSDSSASLGGSMNLNEEVKMQKAIIQEIQRRALRSTLMDENRKYRTRQRIIPKIVALSSSISATAIAAVMVIMFVISPMAQIMKQESLQYASSIDSSAVRGGAVRGDIQEQTDPLQTQLLNIYSLITQKQFDQANKNVKQLIHDLQTTQDIHSEEHKEIFDQAQWLCAICEMHQKNVFKAKKLLRQIANSDSYYAERAQIILDKL